MRELRLVLLGVAAIFALYLGGAFLTRAFKSPSGGSTSATIPTAEPPQAGTEPDRQAGPSRTGPPPDDATPATALSAEALQDSRAAVEHSIADTPDFARFFDRLRLLFPSDYETIMTRLAARYAGKTVNVDVVMADAVDALRKAHGTLAAKSSDAALAQIYAMELTNMRALEQHDPHLCVALLYGANVAGFTSFSADHRPLVADTAVATLDAMHSGRTDQVQRAAPSDGDFKTLDRALVDKGLTRPEIETILDGAAANPPIPDEAMCKAGQNYLEALAALPADIRTRLYQFSVDLMAKS